MTMFFRLRKKIIQYYSYSFKCKKQINSFVEYNIRVKFNLNVFSIVRLRHRLTNKMIDVNLPGTGRVPVSTIQY